MVQMTMQFMPSHAIGNATQGAAVFGTDLAQGPVHLSGTVVPSASFASLMLVLGEVVRLRDAAQPRDHSAYQEWVQGEYLKELPAALQDARKAIPQVLRRRNKLTDRSAALSREALRLCRDDMLLPERRRFWRWLKDHNREAWVVLDPIISVQPDATFFEAFSKDESMYARVSLPTTGLALDAPLVVGTTNIDFSVALERELERVRTYRPLHLSVGSGAVGVSTGVSGVHERKIELPDSWVRGLIEVQAGLALAAVEIDLPSPLLADIIARLSAERERTGPRALVFELTPGEPVRVVVEPWGEVFSHPDTGYVGEQARRIRVWGRRRLRVLAAVLPDVETVRVRLIDDGMPSFWSVRRDNVDLTIGLSGWTSQSWAGRARFAAMIPASGAQPEAVRQAADALRAHLALTVDAFAKLANLEPAVARSALQQLCAAGQAMFDSGIYRHRVLFADLDLQAGQVGREERLGIGLARDGDVTVDADDFVDGVRQVLATVTDGDRSVTVRLDTDADRSITYAQCTCSHFRYHKLRQGPCRHMVALLASEATA